MSRSNPAGNNLGAGYTGQSGGTARPTWIQESVDLTAFAGGTVWLRFSYVTDDAVLHEGMVLDDVRVDAVGFADGDSDSRLVNLSSQEGGLAPRLNFYHQRAGGKPAFLA